MIIYQSIPVTKHKFFNYTKTLRSVIAFLTMSGRSYWDLLSSEPQVWWKARPALLWVLLQKSCTEQKPMRLNRMSQNVNFVDWLTKKNMFFGIIFFVVWNFDFFHQRLPLRGALTSSRSGSSRGATLRRLSGQRRWSPKQREKPRLRSPPFPRSSLGWRLHQPKWHHLQFRNTCWKL